MGRKATQSKRIWRRVGAPSVPILLLMLACSLGLHMLGWLAIKNVPGASVKAVKRSPLRMSMVSKRNTTKVRPTVKELTPDGKMVTLPNVPSPAPKQADYKARVNKMVKRQTRARKSDPNFKVAGKAKPSISKRPQSAAVEARQKLAKVMGDTRIPSRAALKKLSLSKTNKGGVRINTGEQTNGLALLQKPSQSLDPSELALAPSADVIAEVVGSQAPNHLPDLEDGDETSVNAMQFRHAPFFDRVKSAVSRRWRIKEAYRREDPYGDVYGTLTMHTSLKIELDRGGNIVRIRVLKPSRAEFADKAALNAFRRAAPFTNPPKELFGDKESFAFRFDFYVDPAKRSLLNFDWKPY